MQRRLQRYTVFHQVINCRVSLTYIAFALYSFLLGRLRYICYCVRHHSIVYCILYLIQGVVSRWPSLTAWASFPPRSWHKLTYLCWRAVKQSINQPTNQSFLYICCTKYVRQSVMFLDCCYTVQSIETTLVSLESPSRFPEKVSLADDQSPYSPPQLCGRTGSGSVRRSVVPLTALLAFLVFISCPKYNLVTSLYAGHAQTESADSPEVARLFIGQQVRRMKSQLGALYSPK